MNTTLAKTVTFFGGLAVSAGNITGFIQDIIGIVSGVLLSIWLIVQIWAKIRLTNKQLQEESLDE